MLLESRIKRLRELAGWFNRKHKTSIELRGDIDIHRILYMAKTLKTAIVVCKPVCYYCKQAIKVTDIEIDTDEVTIHHKDENRQNDNVDNLVLITRRCHQTMHKLAIAANLPTLIFMEQRMVVPREN